MVAKLRAIIEIGGAADNDTVIGNEYLYKVTLSLLNVPEELPLNGCKAPR